MSLNFKRIICFNLSLVLSFLIPRSYEKVVIGSRDGKRFADNSRYFFHYLNKKKKFNVTWLTKSNKILNYLKKKKFNVYKTNSLLGLYCGFRAGYHIFDYSEYDTSEFSSIRANKINLGHGVYIKKIEKRVKKPNFFHKTYNFIVNKKNYHIYPNKKYSKHILNYFPKNKYKLIVSNFPRNIFFYDKKYLNSEYITNSEKKMIKKINLIKGRKIGYFPTWRKSGQDLFLDVKNYSKLDNFNRLLKKNNSFLIIKHHSNHFKEDSINKKKHKIPIDNYIKNFSNFINLNYDIDLNTIMYHCDLLISDYSGAIIDYLITGKPIILYIPDYNEFKTNPGLFFDYKKFDFCHKIKKYDKLIDLVKEYFFDEEKFKQKFANKRISAKNIFFENDIYFEKIIEPLNNLNK